MVDKYIHVYVLNMSSSKNKGIIIMAINFKGAFSVHFYLDRKFQVENTCNMRKNMISISPYFLSNH